MRFDELHAFLPYVTEGDKHSEVYDVYDNVRCKFPGKHAMDTDPVGGDFVVEVNCSNAGWSWKQFTHIDIFKDIEEKTKRRPRSMQTWFAPALSSVVMGEEIPEVSVGASLYPGVKMKTLLQASQALAVAEHRRYHRFEKNGGGRFLPVRFANGIIFGHWTAEQAAKVQRRGSHGLRELTKEFGNPPTIKRLIKETV